MSSYLNIFVKPRKGDKPLFLTSFSKSSDVYQQFNENFSFYSSEGKKTEITDGMMNQIEANLSAEINKNKDRYIAYLEAKEKTDTEDIISVKEYIKDLEDCRAQLSVLHEIVWECDCKTSDFEKVLAYID